VRLERHVGGLGIARKKKYLLGSGWVEGEAGWESPEPDTAPVPLNKAVHHQLTWDLTRAMGALGWKVASYSERGYARMQDPIDESLCSLPAALRKQARREGRPVGQLTYSLFLAALLDPVNRRAAP
jgi:hypothetical protein